MKKLNLRTLLTCIVTLIIVMLFFSKSNAQSNSQSATTSTNSVPSCNCTKPGYGCFGTQMYCMMYCRWKCRRVYIENDNAESGSTLSNPTMISFLNEQAGRVSLKVYDVTNRLVTSITDKSFEQGEHSIAWNGKNENGEMISPGIYTLKMYTGENTETENFVIVE